MWLKLKEAIKKTSLYARKVGCVFWVKKKERFMKKKSLKRDFMCGQDWLRLEWNKSKCGPGPPRFCPLLLPGPHAVPLLGDLLPFLPPPQITFTVTFHIPLTATLGDKLLLATNVSRWAGPGPGQRPLPLSLLPWGTCQLGSSSSSGENNSPKPPSSWSCPWSMPSTLWSAGATPWPPRGPRPFRCGAWGILSLRRSWTSAKFKFYRHPLNW